MFEKLIALLMNNNAITETGATLTAYRRHTTPATEEQTELFREINKKYCNSSEETELLTDMFVYRIDENNPKCSVFLKVDALTKLYEESGEIVVITTVLNNIKYAQFIMDQAEAPATAHTSIILYRTSEATAQAQKPGKRLYIWFMFLI